MRLRACAFDLGNTLIDDTELQSTAISEIAQELARRGAVPSADDFVATYLSINHADELPFRSHTFGDIGFFSETLQRLSIATICPEELLSAYRQSVRRRTRRDPLVVAGLEYLRNCGMKTALISNESRERVDAYLDDTATRELFDAVIVSESVQVEKPDARIFHIALGRLDCSAEETAMFGDNEIADGACKQVGMVFVHVAGFKRTDWGWERGAHFVPDFVIEHVDRDQLSRLLETIGRGDGAHE